MASRILGLIRDQVLAFYFGAGDAMDAFRVAFRLPNLLRDLFAEGAMTAAFVPTFTHELAIGGKPRAFTLANSVISALLVITGTLVLLGIVFAEPLVRFYADDFVEVPGKIELTVRLARIMVPVLTLIMLAAVFMGMLNALGHFFIPALSPAMFNVATILIAIIFIPLSPAMGVEPIVFIAIATLVGGLGQLLIQWRPLASEGFSYRPRLDIGDSALHRVLFLMGPGTIGMAATQINILVNTQFAASQGTGAVSWLDYAFRLMYVPIGLFGVSVASASTPALSRLAASADFASMRTTLASAIGLMLVLNVPATVGLIALAQPIVALIFEHGNFTSADTVATARALQFYAIGLVAYSVVRIVSPAFYALRVSRIPVTASVISVIANISLNIVLVRVMGFAGLALGTSLAAMINAAVQLVMLRRRLSGIEGWQMTITFLKIVLASALMGVVGSSADGWLRGLLPGTSVLLQSLRLAAAIALSLGVLIVLAYLFRIREFDQARRLVLARLRRSGR